MSYFSRVQITLDLFKFRKVAFFIELNLLTSFYNSSNLMMDPLIIGSPLAEPMFHFAGSGENLRDTAKSRDASTVNKEFSSFLQILMKQISFLF